MNGQIRYGSARSLTAQPTPEERRQRLADPSRFTRPPGARTSVVLLGIPLVVGALLIGAPREIQGGALLAVLGGVWLAVVLAVTLPSRAERAGVELTRRLGHFRHAVNALGDSPTRSEVEAVLALAGRLELREDEIRDEVAQLRASLSALTLHEQIAAGHLPQVPCPAPLDPGDACHLAVPVRFGRRRSDGVGHLALTSGWVKFRGSVDLSVPWADVIDVQRAGSDLIVLLDTSSRALRFSCDNLEAAARAGVIAQHLMRSAHGPSGAPPQARHYEVSA